jgi:hypothetical protein
MVEGHLESMLYPHGSGTLDVHDEDFAKPCGVARESQKIGVAVKQPVREADLQSRLKEDTCLAVVKRAERVENPCVVGRARRGVGALGAAPLRGESPNDPRLDSCLEDPSGARKERGDRLRCGSPLLDEGGSRGVLLHPQPEVSLALLETDELRDVGGREATRSRMDPLHNKRIIGRRSRDAPVDIVSTAASLETSRLLDFFKHGFQILSAIEPVAVDRIPMFGYLAGAPPVSKGVLRDSQKLGRFLDADVLA